VAYLKGDLETTEPYGIHQVYSASKKALNDLGITVVQDARKTLSAKIIAKDSEDNKITIRLMFVSDTSTKLSMRIPKGDPEGQSHLIYIKIRDHLQSGLE
jgi:hypothetical protein